MHLLNFKNISVLWKVNKKKCLFISQKEMPFQEMPFQEIPFHFSAFKLKS